jgi:hypothetical protein
MTIRGGGDPAVPHGFQTALKNGPAAPELRRDAHDCIMVVILTDQPNTRLRGKSAPDRELPSELSLLARTNSPVGTSPRDGLRPPLTVPARGGQSKSGRHHEIVASWSNKEMEKIED